MEVHPPTPPYVKLPRSPVPYVGLRPHPCLACVISTSPTRTTITMRRSLRAHPSPLQGGWALSSTCIHSLQAISLLALTRLAPNSFHSLPEFHIVREYRTRCTRPLARPMGAHTRTRRLIISPPTIVLQHALACPCTAKHPKGQTINTPALARATLLHASKRSSRSPPATMGMRRLALTSLRHLDPTPSDTHVTGYNSPHYHRTGGGHHSPSTMVVSPAPGRETKTSPLQIINSIEN